MKKSVVWPDLGASHSYSKTKYKLERSHSFAGALKKQQNNKSCPSGSTSNISEAIEVAASSPVTSATSTPNVTDNEPLRQDYEEWKQTQKLKRQSKKHEKQLRREEELRRQMVAPKGYRVQVVTDNSTAKPMSPTPQVITELGEFPELGSTVKPQRMRIATLEAPTSVESTGEISTPELGSPSKKSNIKRRDPIIIDLHQMIVPRIKKQVANRHETKQKAKREEEKLSGNPLDSSQPVRHRGKVREIPKPKRPSALKTAILKNRQTKKSLRQQELDCSASSEETPGEISISEQDRVSEGKSVASTEKLQNISTKDIIHSLKFREYCDHMLSPALDEATRVLLSSLTALQDKAHARDPDKARVRRKLLTGLHEARKALVLKKAVLLILAPDVEKCPQKGGLDNKITELLTLARTNQVPYMFCLGRRKLGYVLLKKTSISCVAILNTEGVEQEFSAVISLLPNLRDAYQQATSAVPLMQSAPAEISEATDVNKLVVSSLLSVLEQSLQPPKSAAFLQAIEAAGDSD